MTVGPVLNLDAEAETSLDINMDLGVSLGYSTSNIQFAFPSSEEQNVTRVIAPKNTRKYELRKQKRYSSLLLS